jgi:release factor glutamine methyltransferase
MSGGTPKTVAQIIADLTARFSAAGLDTARLDARVLVARAMGRDPSLLFAATDEIPSLQITAVVESFAQRRLSHEPVSRIKGEREFWGLPFKITAATLDPRPDTETVVSAVLATKSLFDGPRILDLGTGTGCILLSILKDWPTASGLGIDVNPGAVAVAIENARALALTERASFQEGDWCAGVAGSFDIVTSNPPYIAATEISLLAPEVRQFDPLLALNGGIDGLSAYRLLVPQVYACLAPNGRLFLEIGADQAAAVTTILAAAGFDMRTEHRDLGGFVRCLEAHKG